MNGHEGETQTEERAARNEVVFREANEKLGEKRQELDIGGLTPFLCECSDRSCTKLVRLSFEQYEHVRGHATWFIHAPGHNSGEERPIEDHDGYLIVEKLGLARRIAEAENPRR